MAEKSNGFQIIRRRDSTKAYRLVWANSCGICFQRYLYELLGNKINIRFGYLHRFLLFQENIRNDGCRIDDYFIP